ncbi:MAG: DUF1778 domain-containing protein, partial [Gammaproteobacteria bacterium]|nr:DUF1778 domain-containing protein [Gammaproteobacteria bacterium]
EAENVLLDQRLFLADEDAFKAFQTLLDAPVAENEALRYLLNQKSPWKD